MSTISAHTTRVSTSIRREWLIFTLNKLEDRDTLKSAVDELNTVIQNLDAQGVSFFVGCLCKVERQQKNYARKECLRLFVSLASSSCPSRDVFLSPSTVSKTTRFLIESFDDRDAGVRETAAKTFAMIAQQWSLFHRQLISGEPSNIFIKRLFKALNDSKKELQITASDALSALSPWLEALNKELIRECLRMLRNPNFGAKANLLHAIASIDVDTHEPRGVAKANAVSFRPHVFNFIGCEESTQQSGHGLLHLIYNPDWTTRKAAVDSLQCLTLLYGSNLFNSKRKTMQKIKQRLQGQRFDRVKPVRDAVNHTLELYGSLSDPVSEDKDEQSDKEQQSLTTSCVPFQAELAETEVDGVSCVDEAMSIGRGLDDDTSEKESIMSTTTTSRPKTSNPLQRLSFVTQLKARRLRDARNLEKTIKPDTEQEFLPVDAASNRENQRDPQLVEIPRTEARDHSVQSYLTVIESSQNRFMESLAEVLRDFKSSSSSIQNEMMDMKQTLQTLLTRAMNSEARNNSWTQARDGDVSLTQDVPAAVDYDLDTLFSSALSSEWKLLRLMQRTSPVIPELSHSVVEDLIAAFCNFISEKRFLSRVFPWLWQLTEPSQQHLSATLPLNLQQRLLHTLTTLGQNMPKEIVQLEALISVLSQRWSIEGSDNIIDDHSCTKYSDHDVSTENGYSPF